MVPYSSSLNDVVPVSGYVLTNNIRLARRNARLGLLKRYVHTMLVVAERVALLLTLGAQIVQTLLGAEARICRAHLNQLPRIFLVYLATLGLYVWAKVAAHIRAFVVVKPHFAQRLVYQVGSTRYLALLIGVLNSQNKLAVRLGLGQQVCKQRRAQIAHMHVTRGAGRKTCAYHRNFLQLFLGFLGPMCPLAPLPG